MYQIDYHNANKRKGMVKSDLAREFKTNVLMAALVETYMIVMSKTAEAGARSIVLAAMSKENGLYHTDYQSNEEYKK